MPLIRLGTASPATQPTRAATITAIAGLASRAASQSIDILLLPEAYIGGYPRGTHFGASIGARTEDGREEYARYFDAAVDLGDTVGEGGGGAGEKWVRRELGEDRGDGTREELEKIARDSGVFIVTGLVEKAGGTLYCSAVYICPKNGMLGKRRKVMPTGVERLCWGQGSPSTLRAVSTTIRGVRINMAAAICWENYMPLLRQSIYAQNVNLYLAPTADARDAWMGLMRTVGCEGRCFVVSSNMAVRAGQPMMSAPTTAVSAPRRRNSTFTEDGFEIALPATRDAAPPPPVPAVAPPPLRRRRQSIIDENGNEIVLACNDNTVSPLTTQPKTAAAPAAALTNGDVDAGASWICRGGSSIVSPLGDVLAGPQWEDPDNLIYTDVDFRDCIRGRLDLDNGGSYSRNDSFKFSVEGLDLDPLPY